MEQPTKKKTIVFAFISSTLTALSLVNITIKYGSVRWHGFFLDLAGYYRSLFHTPFAWLTAKVGLNLPSYFVDVFVIYFLVGSGFIYILFYSMPLQYMKDAHPSGMQYGVSNRLLLVLYRLFWPLVAVWAIVGMRNQRFETGLTTVWEHLMGIAIIFVIVAASVLVHALIFLLILTWNFVS